MKIWIKLLCIKETSILVNANITKSQHEGSRRMRWELRYDAKRHSTRFVAGFVRQKISSQLPPCGLRSQPSRTTKTNWWSRGKTTWFSCILTNLRLHGKIFLQVFSHVLQRENIKAEMLTNIGTKTVVQFAYRFCRWVAIFKTKRAAKYFSRTIDIV